MRKSKTKRKTRSQPWWKKINPLMMAIGGLLLVGAAGVLIALSNQSPTQNQPLSIGPRLQVDREVIDFGEVRMDIPVRATFKLTNIGDEPVRFVRQPYVQVLEGC